MDKGTAGSIRSVMLVIGIMAGLMLLGAFLAGCDVYARTKRVMCPVGIELHNSEDCDGLESAWQRCSYALAGVGLVANQPSIVHIDPMYQQITGGTSAGTTNRAKDAITLVDDNWANNAFCHEVVHLSTSWNPRHEGWEEAGYWGAIEDARRVQ